MKERIKKAALWLPKKAVLIVVIALAISLAGVFSPYIRQWVGALLPKVDYQAAAVQLTHEMEKAGELIAIRSTDTGVMTGSVNALFLGTVSQVTAPYLYEIGLGVKLSDVVLTPGEDALTVTVPQARFLYDNFEITGEPQNSQFVPITGKKEYQRMQDKQKAACRQAYLDDPSYMAQAWDAVCEQLESLFRQWTGENLHLTFEHSAQ